MYIINDLLSGGDLRFHLKQQGRFSESRAKLYICEIALALNYLHQRRIMHRDVKPKNILLDQKGHAFLTDFNLAIKLSSRDLVSSFTGKKPFKNSQIKIFF